VLHSLRSQKCGAVNDIVLQPYQRILPADTNLPKSLVIPTPVWVVVSCMQLIDVNVIGLQTAQAVLHICPHVLDDLIGIAVNSLFLLIDDVPKLVRSRLCRVCPLTRGPKQPHCDLLVVGGGIEEVDAHVQCSMNARMDSSSSVSPSLQDKVLFPADPMSTDHRLPSIHAQRADFQFAFAQGSF